VRIFAATRHPAVLVGAAAALPRLVALLVERGDILASFTEKSDDFARTFVATGTYGFIEGEPSAYTQPLYGWFLIPLYWIFGRHWLVVGLAQICVAVATAFVVREIGRRFLQERWATLAAVAATLNPYLVWHDIHVNREIVDGLLAALVTLLALETGTRKSVRWAAACGFALGLALLGNARLFALPVLVIAYLAWRWRDARVTALAAAAVVAALGVAIAPWVVRNRIELGCAAITTDSRALWKANNVHTYETLKEGKWIDDVPPLPGAPPSPEQAYGIYRSTGKVINVDECAQMRVYRHEVIEFWKHHPGEKAKLAAQATWMLWDPRVRETTGRPGKGTHVDAARRWLEPVWLLPLAALAVVGVVAAPPSFAVLAVSLLAYDALAAMLFAGTTRYRVPWDFLLPLLGAAGVQRLASRRR
jgi:4-amino-4-deoxy-L-arabinose transferase-like glycosyltransferase